MSSFLAANKRPLGGGRKCGAGQTATIDRCVTLCYSMQHMRELAEPLVAVAFDVQLGQEAGKKGLVLDVDHEAFQEALMQGGMSAEQCVEYPIIIKRTDDPIVGGTFDPSSPDNNKQPAISVKVRDHDSPVTGKVLAHEARHLRDHVSKEHVFLTGRERCLRKVAATVGGLVFGGMTGFADGDTLFQFGSGIEVAVGVGAVLTDMFWSASLIGEYAIRTEERRARASERGASSANLMIVRSSSAQETTGNDDGQERAEGAAPRKKRGTRLRDLAKAMLVPDYSL